MRFYLEFAAGVSLGNLLIALLDGSPLTLGMAIKALLTGVVAAVLLAWFDGRKARRSHARSQT